MTDQKDIFKHSVTNEKTIRKVFDEVLKIHRNNFHVLDPHIKTAISAIHVEYSKEGQKQGTRVLVDYEQASYRCAYLHKYAAFHAALVKHVFLNFCLNTVFIQELLKFRDEVIQICCLGGGPGSDALGIASAFSSVQHLEDVYLNVTVVDCMRGWESTFDTVLNVAAWGYDSLSSYLLKRVKGSYICDDVRCPGEQTFQRIHTADILTMVKFVSAVNPGQIFTMLKEVFTLMRPGAVILFIDNAKGGFHEKVSQAASECGLEAEFEPRNRMKYSSKDLKKIMFGFHSLSAASVAVQMWKKPWYSTFNSISCPTYWQAMSHAGTLEAPSLSLQDTQSQTVLVYEEEDSASENSRQQQLLTKEPESPVFSEMEETVLITRTTSSSSNSCSYSTEQQTTDHSSGDSISAKIRNVILRQIYEKLRSEIFLKYSLSYSEDNRFTKDTTPSADGYSFNVSQASMLPAQTQISHNRPGYFTAAEVRRIVMPQIYKMLESKEKSGVQLSLRNESEENKEEDGR